MPIDVIRLSLKPIWISQSLDKAAIAKWIAKIDKNAPRSESAKDIQEVSAIILQFFTRL